MSEFNDEIRVDAAELLESPNTLLPHQFRHCINAPFPAKLGDYLLLRKRALIETIIDQPKLGLHHNLDCCRVLGSLPSNLFDIYFLRA